MTTKKTTAEAAADQAPPPATEQPAPTPATEQPAPPPATEQPAPTHNIRSVPDTGFWRADHKWHPAGEGVNRADFSDEQWAELLAEPLLVVTAL